MNEFTVINRAELIAAVMAAAERTHTAARRNPVTISLLGTSCKYLFPEGLHESRAGELCKAIRKMPARAFQA